MTRTRLLFALYLVGLARVTLWPELADDDGFDLVHTILEWLDSLGIGLTYSLTEFLANIALFVPFGILVSLLLPRRPAWLVVALGLATSAAIELAQLLFLPHRVADVRDLVANTLGTAVGVGILLVTRHRSRTPEPEGVGAG
ncbi:VanZ family protein [Cellulomonas humilata]|uniref:Glycopeptide antibiotics resistance protein n=1 Tax=Cellulomonas humilata TaxID=144055 RepID=A0ABU0EA23_9CELL|nr:VanZ family protein [Cellulomonas humilata]MDQ0372105.1 glycopeptide antibiotics resistance protein [Cellulomonas humilata]